MLDDILRKHRAVWWRNKQMCLRHMYVTFMLHSSWKNLETSAKMEGGQNNTLGIK